MRYVELPGTAIDTLDDALALPETAFEPLGTRYIDRGTTPNTIWLRLRARNPDDRDGEWRLSLNVRFMTNLLVYRRRDGGGELLLDQREHTTFERRPLPLRSLVVPLAVAAGETADLLIGYRSNGTTALPLSFETPASFEERYARETIINTASYAAVAFLIALSLLQAVTFRQPNQFSYAFYLSSTLAYILHMDGVTFQYLWPGSPLWNSYAAIPLGLVMSAAALWFTRGFVQAKAVSVPLDRFMLGMIVLVVALQFAWPFVPEARLKGIAYFMASASAATCLGAAVLAYLRAQPAMRFFLIGWSGVFFGVAATSLANNLTAVVAHNTAMVLPKLTIMFDALMFYMALADRARAWRRERDAASRREVEALRAHQRVTDQLHQVERERLEALVLAQAKSQQLAMASHDIRQPLTSLRLTAERLKLAGGTAGGVAERLQQSLEYLQRLTDEYSSQTVDATLLPAQAPKLEAFPLRTVLDNIDLMFREEAVAKGLQFRCRTSVAEVRGDAMSAMRLVGNLVANAIKYTERGRVLVGCRRCAAGVRIVVADTGPGIEPAELERLMRFRERGEAAHHTDGHGLGLGIAAALAATNGYRLTCRSTPGRGTMFFVDLDATDAAGLLRRAGAQ